MALPVIAAAGLAVPLIGGVMSLVGGGLSLAGGLINAGSTVAGGVMNAAGGMFGGGESGNVQRDDEDGFERVYGATPFSGTGSMASSGVGLPAVIPQEGLVTTDMEESSPQDTLMSIFKSIQSSLISIDSTLKQMLGVESAALGVEQKNDIRDNLERGDQDNNEGGGGERGPGFLSRIGGGIGNLAKNNASLLKTLGLSAAIIAFVKYKDQITNVVSDIIAYFQELFTIFQADGISGVIDQIGQDMTGIFESIGNLLVKGFDSLMMGVNKALFPEQYGGEERRYISGETLQSTGNQIVDNVLLATGSSTFDEAYNEALNNAQTVTERAEDPAIAGRIGEGLLNVDMLDDYRELTKQSGGKIQWSVDLNDKSIPYQERMEAQPVVEGVEYTLTTLPDLGKVPPTDYDQVIKEKGYFEEIPTKSGSYKYLTTTEQIIKAREQIARDMTAIQLGDDRYGFGNLLSRRARIQENQNILENLGVENIQQYDGGDAGVFSNSADFQSTFDNNRKELERLRLELEMLKNQNNATEGGTVAIDASKTNNVSNNTTTIQPLDVNHGDNTAFAAGRSRYAEHN